MMKYPAWLLSVSLLLGMALLSVPLWGQESARLMYASFRPEGWDIYLSKDGGKHFSASAPHESLEYAPTFSPDGNWLVFTSERTGRPQLFIQDLRQETTPRQLIESTSMQDQAEISPDGQSLLFVSTHEGNADIYLLPFSPAETLDLSAAINLTRDPGGDFRPRYSHDGSRIAFCSDRAHPTRPHSRYPFAMQRTGDIFTMTADGSRVQRLTNSKDWEGSPVWATDDQSLYYYRNQATHSVLYQMKADGSDQQALASGMGDAYSPVPVGEQRLRFTYFDPDEGLFGLRTVDLATGHIDSSLVLDVNLHQPTVHPKGWIAACGGPPPPETEQNQSGFDGDLLVKGNPKMVPLGEDSVALFGVRRAFAAPPIPGKPEIVFDHVDANGFQEVLTPWGLPLLLLPVLGLIGLGIGVVRSIRQRKEVASWKHLLFGLTAIAIPVGILLELGNRFLNLNQSIPEIQRAGLIYLALLLALAFFGWQLWRRRKHADRPVAGLYRLWTLMLGGNGLLLAYGIMVMGLLIQIQTQFLQVNYESGEVKELFTFEADAELNPMLQRIIDTKFSPDGAYLQFSVGGFRGRPEAQGAIYRYSMAEQQLERLTELAHNHAFADFSEDNQSMVYRSGETGNMDIYWKSGEQLENLTQSEAKENFPVISPDGKRIVYCSDVDGVDKEGTVITMELYLREQQADGSWGAAERLTDTPGQEGHPHFSHDGKWLFFSTEAYGINDEQPLVQAIIFSPQLYGEIAAIRLSDRQIFRLTHNKWEDGAPLSVGAVP